MSTPSNHPIMQAFLQQQVEVAAKISRHSDLLNAGLYDDQSIDRFIIELRCFGLTCDRAGNIVRHNHWLFGVGFPPDYLQRELPAQEVVVALGPRPLYHANVNGRFLCLKIRPGTGLRELAFALADLVSWRSYSLADPLNNEAAQWARNQADDVLPVDNRPLAWQAGQREDTTEMSVELH